MAEIMHAKPTPDITTVFMRYEVKYIVTKQQQKQLESAMEAHTVPDGFGESAVCNVYYDSPDFRMIRASIEKPQYKEKLRIRSYGVPAEGAAVFAELKKKCGGVVFKRRAALTESEAGVLAAGGRIPRQSQIISEIGAAAWFYRAEPKVWLAYDRIALYGADDPTFRVTFDSNIRWRTDRLTLSAGDFGDMLTDRDAVIMEVKTAGALPLWFVKLISDMKIYPGSFSKYGECYRQYICNNNVQKVIRIGDARYAG